MNDGRKNSMHLKAAVFDDTILWRGSANCSIAADTANSEDISRILVLRKKRAA